MISILKRISIAISITLLSLILVLGLLTTTTAGLLLTIHLANLFLPGTINVSDVRGSLLRPISFTQLTYDDKSFRMTVTNGSIDMRYRLSHHPTLVIQHITAEQVALNVFDSIQQELTHVNLSGEINRTQWIVNNLSAQFNHVQLSLHSQGQNRRRN